MRNDYKDKRIDELEDKRFEKLCSQVDGMHKMLVGNGQPGLIRTVAKNSAKIKILITILSIILTAALGGTLYKCSSDNSDNSDNSDKLQQAQKLIELVELVEVK